MTYFNAVRFSIILLLSCFLTIPLSHAQPVLETGGRNMPNEWIDSATHHKIIRITRRQGNNLSFYFHNNPFIDNKMLFYGKDEHRKSRLFIVDLSSFKIEQLTHRSGSIKGEILSTVRKEVFYQEADTVYACNVYSGRERVVYIFPTDFKGDITTVNAELGGVFASPEEKEISKLYPQKHDYFNRIYEAKLPRTLFTIDIETGRLNKLFTDNAWLNHVQFSPTNPYLMMFCHEGPWHKVDRIWTIDTQTKQVQLIHRRTMDMEIAGHEWFSSNGKTIWYDLQLPRGKTFCVGGTKLESGKEVKYDIGRDGWSVHYTSSINDGLFAGDGGDSAAVAKAKDGKWIYLFKPDGDQFIKERLVCMKNHQYRLEPNVHFSPDSKWIIFRANFEGVENVYAVEIAAH